LSLYKKKKQDMNYFN